MKLYCKVENNVVTQPPGLLSVQNELKSDFDLLDEGWYYVQQILPDTFDERFEVMETIEYEILPTKVKATYIKRPKTSDEMQQFRDNKLHELQQQQTQALIVCEEVMNVSGSIYNILSIQEREHWRDFKKTVQDLFILNDGKESWEISFPPMPLLEPLSIPPVLPTL